MAVETINKSHKSDAECPLCLETLDLDDKSFYPCTCGYQICRFCWHRILSESSLESPGSCPACRKPYSSSPSSFKPLSADEVQLKLKQQRKQKDEKKKKTLDSRKHLSDLRVVQKNLVFVVGITPRIADVELLKKNEYFGKFGRIYKIVVNCVGQSTTTPSTPSYGAYITYTRSEDALRAIQSVNNVPFDGKTIKASLGTTKYCSHFMRNAACPKSDCMYLHSQGDPNASFTKEDMQQGKHQEYEKKLIEEFNKENGFEEEPEEYIQPLLQMQLCPVAVPPLVQQPEEQVQEQEPLLNFDFDPFYETQKAFESIIQTELAHSYKPAPPGFNNNNKWQEEWIDPAIIYSSNYQENGQQRSQIGHLLGNSLLNDIFASNSSSIQVQQQQQQQQQQYSGNWGQQQQQQNGQKMNAPPPGFHRVSAQQQSEQFQGEQQQQFMNNNFFNTFPF